MADHEKRDEYFWDAYANDEEEEYVWDDYRPYDFLNFLDNNYDAAYNEAVHDWYDDPNDYREYQKKIKDAQKKDDKNKDVQKKDDKDKYGKDKDGNILFPVVCVP
ncbi:hypothetical protein E4U13_003937 [Claviceps humidiphila]|uniref:Uncharacterized protein n=1 Tax=Claviceps humidiphila TaxID=1294629 RepID=A0A9P7TTG5_9HYPO|nr:hypothetical protein E4U13_003937 [Claviceps humidiphila]